MELSKEELEFIIGGLYLSIDFYKNSQKDNIVSKVLSLHFLKEKMYGYLVQLEDKNT